jgi:hypothetical protein
MSGMEPMIIGAVAGAALNRDDPLKGAMMGAALGGGAGGLLSGATGAATGAAAAEAGAMGAAEGAIAADAIPAFLANQPTIGPSGLMPVDMLPVNAYPAAETIPVFNNEAIARASMGGDFAGIGSGAPGSSMYGPADLGWMDRISPSQQAAIEAGNFPGMSSPLGDIIGYEEAAGKELAKAQAKDAFMRGGGLSNMMSASSGLLRQAQPRTQMQAPGIRRGQPQAVNYGGLASLLEPKLVERRRLSLL